MRVQLPDGKIAEFPDDMSPEAISEVIKQQYLSPSREIDTRTNMAVPTFDERAQAGSTLARQGLPIIGDIGLSLLAKRHMPGVTSQLFKRMGPLTQKLLRGATNMTGEAAAAGAGSAAGEYAAQKVFNEPPDMDMVQNQMVYGTVTDLGFNTLTKVAGKTLKYFQKSTSGGQRATKAIADNLLDQTTERAE
jgi:hypothetical protein